MRGHGRGRGGKFSMATPPRNACASAHGYSRGDGGAFGAISAPCGPLRGVLPIGNTPRREPRGADIAPIAPLTPPLYIFEYF